MTRIVEGNLFAKFFPPDSPVFQEIVVVELHDAEGTPRRKGDIDGWIARGWKFL